ncbi:MAG: NYN domain-containing protein [Gammaproteobacteria bacterium]|nr:NYN domain-containing protein [Gammaproteobacteria bacterium]
MKRIALLIDCDNVSHSSIEGVLAELANYGVVNVRHAHGDWNSPSLSGWRDKLHPNAIRPMQQFAYTKGKNATDSAMIIDAMDLLYSKSVDAFALMTSDSDFTPLVLRILENGLPVYGFGEKKTPQPFVDACSPFIYTENLVTEDDEKPDIPQQLIRKNRNELRGDTSMVRLLRTAAEQTSEDDGWSDMSKVAHYISNNSSFSSINYGYKKLGDLVRASELFDIEMRKEGKAMYVKDIRKGVDFPHTRGHSA